MDDSTAGILILIVGAVIYFAPSLIARTRKRKNLPAIFALNFFLGWTLAGWVAALVWAITTPDQQTVTVAPQPTDRAAELERLADLRDRGVLSEEEFQSQKQRLLAG